MTTIAAINTAWFEDLMATEKETKLYKKTQDAYLYTTRFNDTTYEQNRRFCALHKRKCLYSNPHPLPQNTRNDAPVYVIEMNNSQNKIMGIGKIFNRLEYREYAIYDAEHYSYNERTFEGVDHIDINNLDEKYKPFLDSLERFCFYGRTHLKRGHRMLSFPIHKQASCAKNGLDLTKTIEMMFHEKNKNKNKKH